jgi:PDZ domain-containing protein
MATRTEISVRDTQHETVVARNLVAPSFRAHVVGTILATVSFLIIGAVLVAMVWPLERYESAPGRAESVGERIRIPDEDVDVFPAENGIRFVTAMGTRVNPLQSFMGWVDPYVDVLTCEQRFGDCDPQLNREVQLGAMSTAKEIAAYVALSRLGFDAKLEEGPAQVAGFDPGLCPEDAPPNRACRALAVGDVVRSIEIIGAESAGDVVRTDTLSQLAEALTAAKPGDVARLTVTSLDSDDERTADVELVADPEEGRTLIGFIARDTRTVDLPFDIEIDTDRIGGPSAGLSFTLALIDALTKGELTPDGGVAVTGTIADDGSVGAIGLLLQKAIAVRQSGVEYFLVPASQSKEEIDEARRVVGDDVEIIAVATLEEALNALKRLGGSPITLDR